MLFFSFFLSSLLVYNRSLSPQPIRSMKDIKNNANSVLPGHCSNIRTCYYICFCLIGSFFIPLATNLTFDLAYLRTNLSQSISNAGYDIQNSANGVPNIVLMVDDRDLTLSSSSSAHY